jgi:hypothetical protein
LLKNKKLISNDGMAGGIVRMNGLALEGQENDGPSLLGGKMEDQPAIVVDAVILGEFALVALIHVGVLNE